MCVTILYLLFTAQYYTHIEVCQKFIHAVFLCKTKEEEEEEEEEDDKGFGKPKVQSHYACKALQDCLTWRERPPEMI